MRIAILTNNFPPVLDGVGDYSAHLAAEFERKGHQVAVICRKEAHIAKAIADGAYAFPVISDIPAWNHSAIKPFQQFLTHHKPDWLLVQYVPDSFHRWAMPVWLPILLWLAKRRGIRVGIVFHEVYVRMRFWPPKRWLVAIMQRLICVRLAQLADVLITSIDLYADFLRAKTDKPIHIIPVPTNIPAIPVTESELTAIRKHIIAPADAYIVSIFGLRNQDLVLRVFNRILIQHPNSRLLICGELNISASYEKYYEPIKDKIYVTGFRDATTVYRYLRASDSFFMPDYTDQYGRGGTSNKSTALAAGLTAGLPVVGTLGDMNNSLLLRTPGLLLEAYDNEEALSKALLKPMLDDSRNSLRTRLTYFLANELNWNVIADNQLSIMHNFDKTALNRND